MERASELQLKQRRLSEEKLVSEWGYTYVYIYIMYIYIYYKGGRVEGMEMKYE